MASLALLGSLGLSFSVSCAVSTIARYMMDSELYWKVGLFGLVVVVSASWYLISQERDPFGQMMLKMISGGLCCGIIAGPFLLWMMAWCKDMFWMVVRDMVKKALSE